MPLPNMHKRRGVKSPRAKNVSAAILLAGCCFSTPSALGFADLTPQTEQAFNRYIALAEAKMKQSLHSSRFLSTATSPESRAKLRGGERPIVPSKILDSGQEAKVPNGLIQDWLGAMFIPNTTIARVRTVMTAYPEYQKLFAPEIISSKLLGHDGDRYQVFLRLYKKQILTVVLNTTYDISYAAPDNSHLAIDSRSTRIAEVRRPKQSLTDELPPGQDTGFLWRLNSYWRFEEGDGGVYAQCEAISLSRDVPFGLLMIRQFVERFPRESMLNTLEGVRRAVSK